MSKRIAVGIDIGTYQTKVVVAESAGSERDFPRVIGLGTSETRGLRHGYVTNTPDVVKSIRLAVMQAEKTSGQRINRAFISIGGIGLESVVSNGTVMVSRGDSEIDDLDIQKIHEACEKEIPQSMVLNRKIIHSIPLLYKLDGKTVLGSNPAGLRGNKLECRMLFITCLEQHLQTLLEAVDEAGIEVIDVMAAPMAASLVTLSKSQKIAGCALAIIGAETLTLTVFDENKPRSLEVFQVGSTNITNDIALGFKIALDEAEHMKIGGITTFNVPRKKLDDIIEARLEDMFDLIGDHLKKIGQAHLLPAGIIMTGGGAGSTMIEDVAKRSLGLPARVAVVHSGDPSKCPFNESSWSVAYGLCVWGLSTDDTGSVNVLKIGKKIRDIVLKFVKQFLP
jgi:cell division protein FtsA